MAKTTTSLIVNYEVSTGAHSFYCVAYYYDPQKVNDNANLIVTVLTQAIDRNTLYGGVYEQPARWRLVGAVDIRVLPEPKVIEVRK